MLNTLLVTGGAGFIGSHFIDYCLANTSARIINLDKLGIGSDRAFAFAHQSNPNYHFIHGNICDSALLDDILSRYSVDTIVHFAAESHVDRSIASPVSFTENNILGTATLLEAARAFWSQTRPDWQHCRFHQISTDEVYGDLPFDAAPVIEGAAYHPSSPYAASKASADHLCHAYHRTYGMPITLSQCTNNYGPRQHAEKMIPTIIAALASGQAVPVYGDGLNRRDWLYVGDHIEAIWRILQKGTLGASYHISAMSECNNLELCTQLYHLMQQHSSEFDLPRPDEMIDWINDRPGHDRRYALNADKLKNELGWQPTISFEAGLLATLNESFHPQASIG